MGTREGPLRALGRHFFIKIKSYFAYPILELILDAPGPFWGAILAPQRPPGRSKMTLFFYWKNTQQLVQLADRSHCGSSHFGSRLCDRNRSGPEPCFVGGFGGASVLSLLLRWGLMRGIRIIRNAEEEATGLVVQSAAVGRTALKRQLPTAQDR